MTKLSKEKAIKAPWINYKEETPPVQEITRQPSLMAPGFQEMVTDFKPESKKSMLSKVSIPTKPSLQPLINKQSNLDRLSELSLFNNMIKTSTPNLVPSSTQEKRVDQNLLSRSKSPVKPMVVQTLHNNSDNSKYSVKDKIVPDLPSSLVRDKNGGSSKSPVKSIPIMPQPSMTARSKSPLNSNVDQIKKLSQIKGSGFLFKNDFVADSLRTFPMEEEKKEKNSIALLQAPLRREPQSNAKRGADFTKSRSNINYSPIRSQKAPFK